jgi:hypothetical protein
VRIVFQALKRGWLMLNRRRPAAHRSYPTVKKVRAEWAMICTHNLLKLFALAKAA